MTPVLGLVVVAGGSSRRFGSSNKLFAKLNGKCLFLHCLENLVPFVGAAHTVLVIPDGADELFRVQMPPSINDVKMVHGGAERSSSALAGIQALPSEVNYVAIQDAARPFATASLLEACFKEAIACGGAIAAHRVTDTIKVANAEGQIQETPDRSKLWAAETPQVFRRDWITDAYLYCIQKAIPVTDDAQAVQLMGHPVRLVENTACNMKITYPDELKLAELVGHTQHTHQ